MVLIMWAIENKKEKDEGGKDRDLQIVVFTSDLSTAKKVGVFKDFVEIMDRWDMWDYLEGGKDDGWRRKEEKFIFKSGAHILFMSASSNEKARKGKYGVSYFNEVNSVDKEFYGDVVLRTTRRVIVDYNSDQRFYIHEAVEFDRCGKWSDKGKCLSYKQESEWQIDFYITNFTHNIEVAPFEDGSWHDSEGNWNKVRSFIDDQMIEGIKEYLYKYQKTKNPYWQNKWRVLGLGETGGVLGQVYPHVHWIGEDEFEMAWLNGEYRGYGWDYGYRKAGVGAKDGDPNAFTKNVIWQGRVYSKLLLYEWNMSREKIAQTLIDFEVYDYPIIFDRSNALEVFDYLENHEYGFNIMASKKQAGSVLMKINLLKEHELYFVDDLYYRNEVEKKSWRKIHGDYSEKVNPVDGNDHALDSLKDWRWMIMSLDEFIDFEYEPPQGF